MIRLLIFPILELRLGQLIVPNKAVRLSRIVPTNFIFIRMETRNSKEVLNRIKRLKQHS